jgi:ABC-2 type transport system ATP-binding protein
MEYSSLLTKKLGVDVQETNIASPSIVARGLTMHFDSLVAVDHIDLEIAEGEFFGFLGPNGAGKSTTIKMLCGLLKPTAGYIRVAGQELATAPLEVKRHIGVLPEEPNLYERLNGEEFLIFAGRMYGLTQEEARRRANDLLELFELAEARYQMIVDYSMGMKKKCALAAALIHRPRVIFLDEPFNGIDPVSVHAIRNVLQQLRAGGATIFFSSHVMEVVERLCSRVAIINRGVIVAQGSLADLRAKAQAGGEASLEEVFLTLVQARAEEETLNWL